MNFKINLIFLTNPFLLHDQKAITKIQISWEQQGILRWNKKLFSSFWRLWIKQIKQIFFGRWEADFNAWFSLKELMYDTTSKKHCCNWTVRQSCILQTSNSFSIEIISFWTTFCDSSNIESKRLHLNGST